MSSRNSGLIKPDIIKIGAIILDDKRRILIVKSNKHDFWIFPGGKVEKGETDIECLQRELKEELKLKIKNTPKFYFKNPVTPAAGNPDLTVQITAYLVEIKNKPEPSSEIIDIHWLTKKEYEQKKFKISEQLAEYTIPKLIRDGLF